MPVEVEKLVKELAKNENGLAILGVNIPQGTGNRAHGNMNADEAEHDDGQDKVLNEIEAEYVKRY